MKNINSKIIINQDSKTIIKVIIVNKIILIEIIVITVLDLIEIINIKIEIIMEETSEIIKEDL